MTVKFLKLHNLLFGIFQTSPVVGNKENFLKNFSQNSVKNVLCGVVGSERVFKRVWDSSQQAKSVRQAIARTGRFTEKGTLFLRLRFIRKTHCQKDFVLWRGAARLGGVSGVDFNVLGNPAELIRKLKVNTDIAVFVNLDMVYQFNQDFAGQLFDVLIFRKGYQRGMLLVNVKCYNKVVTGVANKIY